MPETVFNVVFGELAKRVLHDALQRVGRSEDIGTFPDDLSVGPLRPLDGAMRERWIREQLDIAPEDWGVFAGELDSFFEPIKLQTGKIICWVCPNAIYELCGFYECMRRISDRLFFIDTMVASQFEHDNGSNDGFPPRLAHISPLVAAHLIDSETSVSDALRAERLQQWQRLCRENGPLRSIGPAGLESVPIEYFDPFLFASTDTQWRPGRAVITRAAVEANKDNYFRVDMMTLTGRLRALIKGGRLQADRDISDPAANIRLR